MSKKNNKGGSTYERKGLYSVNEVLDKVVFLDKQMRKEAMVDFDGDMIAMNSDRYKTFKKSGVVCVECGLRGVYFAKEKHVKVDKHNPKTYHFNLYGVNMDGTEIMFTKDHIKPVSKGGKDNIVNYQTMCATCNSNKGNGDKVPMGKLQINVRGDEKLVFSATSINIREGEDQEQVGTISMGIDGDIVMEYRGIYRWINVQEIYEQVFGK